MDKAQEQIVEQVAGISLATADMTCGLIEQLMILAKIDSDEALFILRDLAERHRTLARSNFRTQGMALVFNQIAERIEANANRIELKLWARGKAQGK